VNIILNCISCTLPQGCSTLHKELNIHCTKCTCPAQIIKINACNILCTSLYFGYAVIICHSNAVIHCKLLQRYDIPIDVIRTVWIFSNIDSLSFNYTYSRTSKNRHSLSLDIFVYWIVFVRPPDSESRRKWLIANTLEHPELKYKYRDVSIL